MEDFPARRAAETGKAYSAFVAYAALGRDRSLEKARHALAKDSPGYLRVLKTWSAQHAWQARVATYDSAMFARKAALAAQAELSAYRDALENHRARYQKAGLDLYAIASGLLAQCARAIRGQEIQGADGRLYTIPAMELTPASLRTAMQALAIAADLEAHALRLGELLPALSRGGE